jgi:hypothetical protein
VCECVCVLILRPTCPRCAVHRLRLLLRLRCVAAAQLMRCGELSSAHGLRWAGGSNGKRRLEETADQARPKEEEGKDKDKGAKRQRVREEGKKRATRSRRPSGGGQMGSAIHTAWPK